MSDSTPTYPLSSTWRLFESRDEGKLNWDMRKVMLFSADNLQDFVNGFLSCPRLSDVLSRNAYDVKRIVDENGNRVSRTYGVDEYFMTRGEAGPDTSSQDAKGNRHHLNGYRTELTFDLSEFEEFQQCWSFCILSIIGHAVDPEGLISGVRVFTKKVKTTVLRIEIWFSTYSDAKCVEICDRLKQAVFQKTKFEHAKFFKMDYFKEKHWKLIYGDNTSPDAPLLPIAKCYFDLGLKEVQRPKPKDSGKPGGKGSKKKNYN